MARNLDTGDARAGNTADQVPSRIRRHADVKAHLSEDFTPEVEKLTARLKSRLGEPWSSSSLAVAKAKEEIVIADAGTT